MKILVKTTLIAAVLAAAACTHDPNPVVHEGAVDDAPVATDRGVDHKDRVVVDRSVRRTDHIEAEAPEAAVTPDDAPAVVDTTTREPAVLVPQSETAPLKAVDADNTKHNVVDRHATVTPGDQSNAKSDIDITAAIRRGVVKRDGLSTNAKNVKIITRAGRVTLRGPVASASEAAFVDELARGTAGVVAVDNELTVTSH
jgi:hypothetical protein